MKKSLLMSLAIHSLSIFLLLNTNSTKTQNQQEYGDSKTVNIEMIQGSKQSPLEKIDEKKLEDIEGGSNKDDCQEYFGGIGVEVNLNKSQVTKVYDGYPASRAGIMRGDILIPVDGGDVRGEIGTKIILKIVRQYEVRVLELTREKICLK